MAHKAFRVSITAAALLTGLAAHADEDPFGKALCDQIYLQAGGSADTD